MTGPFINSFSEISGRIGLLGGSFDPVHLGHILMAEKARQTFALSQVIFLPTSKNPLKQSGPMASNEQRLEMLKLALHNHPDSLISKFEIENAGPSFTVDTLNQMEKEVAKGTKLYFVFGSDQVPSLHLWKDFARLFELTEMVPVTRNSHASHSQTSSNLNLMQNEMLNKNIIQIKCPFSSSSIRKLIAEGDWAQVRTQIDPQVCEYIKAQGLYVRSPG